jgi:nucleoside phosphorylase
VVVNVTAPLATVAPPAATDDKPGERVFGQPAWRSEHPPVVCSIGGSAVDDFDQKALNNIADQQVQAGKAVSLAAIRGSIMPPPMEPPVQERLDDALARLAPRWLEKHTEAGGGSSYMLTLDGWLESRFAQQANKVIEDMLRLYRKRVQTGNADFNSIPWADIAAESSVGDDLVHLYVAVAYKAGLTNGYSSVLGPPRGRPAAQFNQPNDFDDIVNIKDANDFLRYRHREQYERLLLGGRRLPTEACAIMVRVYDHLVRDGDWPLTKPFNVELRDQHIRLDRVGLANGDLIHGLDTYQSGAQTQLTLRAIALLEDAADDAAWLTRILRRLGERYAHDPETTDILVKDVVAEVGLEEEATIARVARIIAAQGGIFTVQGRPSFPLTTSTFGVGEWFLDFRDAQSLVDIVRSLDERLRQNWAPAAPEKLPEMVPKPAQVDDNALLLELPIVHDGREARDIPRAVVLTALKVEYNAVHRLLQGVRSVTHKQGTVYEQGRLERAGRYWEVVLVEIGAGNNRSAMEAERAINQFEPEVVMFVGVAGGVKDVKLGDVVAGTKVFGYESGKAKAMEFEPRPDVGRSSYRMEQRARYEARQSEWRRLSEHAAEAEAVVGPIAAGEKVVASNRSPIAKFIRKWYGETLAVEMEGRGFLEATHANHIDAIVIRGISDLLSGKQASDKGGSQTRAASNAAAFAMHLLISFEPPLFVRPPPTDPRRSRDLETLRRVLRNLPTTVMDFFFEQAHVDIIQDDALYFWEGFNGEVTASHFALFDTELHERVRALHSALKAMLAFDEHMTSLPSGRAHKLTAPWQSHLRARWERDHRRFENATQAAHEAYGAFVDYVRTVYPEVDLLQTTRETLAARRAEDLDRAPKAANKPKPRKPKPNKPKPRKPKPNKPKPNKPKPNKPKPNKPKPNKPKPNKPKPNDSRGRSATKRRG